MKQFQIAYQNDWSLREELEKIDRWRRDNAAYTTLFKVYSQDRELTHIRHVCDVLEEVMPDAMYFGCTTNANILNGALTPAEIVLVCTVFEKQSTQVKMLALPFVQENVRQTVQKLKDQCAANPWVRAVEVHATILGMLTREFCKEMSTLKQDIQVFGGGACDRDTRNSETTVFAKGLDFSHHGIVFLLLGGPELHICSTHTCGWKPLKRRFKITRAQGNILYELEGEPAFNIYQRFLNIQNSENLAANSLEFPLMTEHAGVDVLRVPMTVNPDRSIMLTAEAQQGTSVRLAYGNPEMILDSISRDGQVIADFQPQVLQVYSCASRRAFWGDAAVSHETQHFNDVAPTAGFYTGGEFLRVDGQVQNFNVTLVLAALREGEPAGEQAATFYDAKMDGAEGEKITLIQRFISFIDASTAEFEVLNKKLEIASITDGLTHLYNRAEIERRIRSRMDGRAQTGTQEPLSVIMLDIDDFKCINDQFGHKEGDRVITALSDVLRKETEDVPACSLGRWGGEEFMILLPNSDGDRAMQLAEAIRTAFAAIGYDAAGPQTVSVGVCQAKPGEDTDALYSRVDKALYQAKDNGKNRVVRLD